MEEWRKKSLLRFDEVMGILGYRSRDPIYNLLRDGKIKAHNPNGTPGSSGTRIITSSIVTYLEKGTIATERWTE